MNEEKTKPGFESNDGVKGETTVAPASEVKSEGHFKVLKTEDGKFRWKQYDAEGNSVAISEFVFDTEQECQDAVDTLSGKASEPEAPADEVPSEPEAEVPADAPKDEPETAPDAPKDEVPADEPEAEVPEDNTQA